MPSSIPRARWLLRVFHERGQHSLGVGISEGHESAVYDAVLLIAAFLAGAIVGTVLAEITGIWALPAVLLLEGEILAASALLAGTG
jgi:uncharacterized membrane protein YoaK (UPF0700 family)